MKIFTIGFTKTSAENFFERLRKAGAVRLVDVRLKSNSQLAGFAKSQDLGYFTRSLLQVDYVSQPLLAPTSDILDGYKKGAISWQDYEGEYVRLIAARRVEERIRPEEMDGACLLCSESLAHKCHRRIAAEYLSKQWAVPVEVRHL